MRCLKCGCRLAETTVDGITVDRCESCSGIWFDIGELDAVVERKRSPELINRIENNAGHDAEAVACPRCGGAGAMLKLSSPDGRFAIDACVTCGGRWLDGGEYERLTTGSFWSELFG